MREAFESMAVLSSQMFQSPEALEGMTAYLEKRPASWVRHVTQNESSS
jgi:enoyl-CoA hydratase/carnithine racemase